jgi:hypothetical protein
MSWLQSLIKKMSEDKKQPKKCDHCAGELKPTWSMPHEERGGILQVYECRNCKLPVVVHILDRGAA